MDLTMALVEAKVSCKEMSDSCQELTDSCKELADSYKSLAAMAADLLSSWEQLKFQQAAATSVPSTTTTAPPNSRVPASATSDEASTGLELAMGSPLQFSVLPELARPARATCSMECRDVHHKQCEATSVPLEDADVFTVVQKGAVLPSTTES